MPHATSMFRLTPQRAAVFDVVREARDHPTAREIYMRVKDCLPGIGFATVYRTLNLLAAHGEILELQLGDDAVARYDANTASHEHIRCTSCGAIADIHAPLPDSTTRQAARDSGFTVDGYELKFLGRCAGCQISQAG
ncbi:MAG: Fur family transcriptional regulator [Egibacteraceae bacterium]